MFDLSFQNRQLYWWYHTLFRVYFPTCSKGNWPHFNKLWTSVLGLFDYSSSPTGGSRHLADIKIINSNTLIHEDNTIATLLLVNCNDCSLIPFVWDVWLPVYGITAMSTNISCEQELPKWVVLVQWGRVGSQKREAIIITFWNA
jgi:hypothetical protein